MTPKALREKKKREFKKAVAQYSAEIMEAIESLADESMEPMKISIPASMIKQEWLEPKVFPLLVDSLKLEFWLMSVTENYRAKTLVIEEISPSPMTVGS